MPVLPDAVLEAVHVRRRQEEKSTRPKQAEQVRGDAIDVGKMLDGIPQCDDVIGTVVLERVTVDGLDGWIFLTQLGDGIPVEIHDGNLKRCTCPDDGIDEDAV
jgi:hypothetical protein